MVFKAIGKDKACFFSIPTDEKYGCDGRGED
jgi:hypothetical protein